MAQLESRAQTDLDLASTCSCSVGVLFGYLGVFFLRGSGGCARVWSRKSSHPNLETLRPGVEALALALQSRILSPLSLRAP